MTRHIAAASILASLALAGCYAELEDKSVTIARPMPICDPGAAACAFQGVPAGLENAPLAVAGGATDFTLDLGDQEILKAERKEGPVSLKGNLKVDQATLATSTPGASFAGVRRLDILQLPFASAGPSAGSSFDACVTPADCPVVATYDRDVDGPAEDRLLLRGTGVNLLTPAGSQVTLRFVASGTLPTTSWGAVLTLQAEFKARASFP